MRVVEETVSPLQQSFCINHSGMYSYRKGIDENAFCKYIEMDACTAKSITVTGDKSCFDTILSLRIVN